ncbi:putative prolycopenC2 and GRAM domain-containing protein [Helianthus annuus]|nr:putative prolycopenC2 and GRAM domain-containing protein [Helianthus annuus]
MEDVEDIHSLPPTLASVGSPILVMVLLKGRGVDARHGAKCQDEKGRLCFYFHSFVSFSSARRTIMALWRTRSSSPDPKTDVFEDTTVTSQDHQHQERDEKCLCEDVTSHLVVGDAKMTKIYSEELPISLESIMEIFKGGDLEHKVMGKLWCLNYKTTPWEPVTGHFDMLERRLCWKFNRRVSSFGGDVTCTQQKLPIVDGKGWTITEAMALHDVPFGDHFYVSHCKLNIYTPLKELKNLLS